MNINEYFSAVSTAKKSGHATEHSYRGYLQSFVETLCPEVQATNEPKRQKCGAPDYVVMKKEIPLGYIEAKDILPGILEKKETQAQVKKYFDGGLGYNFILTDYLEFRFYREENLVGAVRIADEAGDFLSEEAQKLEQLLKNFCSFHGQTVRSSKKLSEMMAGKARMIKTALYGALQDEDRGGELRDQFQTFQNILLHDMTEAEFSDIYAQTITYGLFAARLHDPTLPTFDRYEAAELLPTGNPFLKRLFQSLAINLDQRIAWIVDDLIELFKACNVREILLSYGKTTKRHDPVVHFYEDFLAEYDPKMRKARGVWYTPEPVVHFIVRGMDELLKTAFGIADGLASTEKTTIAVEGQEYDKRKKQRKIMQREVHKVQLLDPATGTGTFLAEVVRQIAAKFEDMPGIWNSYIEHDLVPRLHGFEILMASYAMAHLKMDLLLTELGYTPKKQERIGIYLTNSLEEAHPDTHTLFSSFLATEANEANHIKKEMPIMCVFGNPPYSVSSSNKGEWIQNLIADYKKDLNEKKINLDDDYIKFLRYSEHYIEKNGSGIVAMITNNSFLDGVTHRQMRKHLLETFDKIYIYDLHGNAKKKETCPDGSKDENVFDIMQGVSIFFGVKNKNLAGLSQKKEQQNTSSKHEKNKEDLPGFGLAEVYHYDSYGKRQVKYDHLTENSISTIPWKKLEYKEPYYFFVPKDFGAEEKYMEGFSVAELFPVFNSGVKTDRDSLFIDYEKEEVAQRMQILLSGEFDEKFREEYRVKDSGSYKITQRIQGKNFDEKYLQKIQYRPFDYQWIYYDPKIISRPANKVMKEMINKENIGFLVCRQQSTFDFQHCLLTNNIADCCAISSQTREFGYLFPLYLYSDEDEEQEDLGIG